MKCDLCESRRVVGMRRFEAGFEFYCKDHSQFAENKWPGALYDRIEHARSKHPEGPTFAALVEEVGEVARVINDFNKRDEYKSELLDVATVSIRLWMEDK